MAGSDDPVEQPELRRQRGRALMTRFLRTGVAADLDAAVEDFGAAFAALSDGDPDEVSRAALDLSWALESRFDLRQGRDEQFVTYWDVDNNVELLTGPPDLVRGIFVLDRLLGRDDPGSAPPPELRWRMKRNLANELVKYAAATRGTRSPQDRAADVVRAVDLLLQARTEMPADSPEAGTVIASLLAALDDSPDLSPELENQLVTSLEQSAVTALPEQAALIRLNLADLWVARGRVDEGVALFRTLTAPDEPATTVLGARLTAADRWAFSALRRGAWSEVLEAHAAVSSLTARLRASSADWDDRYRWSRTGARVATAAASALVRLGRPAAAAAALQAGRTLELTQRLGTGAGGADRPGTGVYLLSTPGGTDALLDVGGEWAAMALPDLAPDALLDRAKPYVEAFDSYRRFPSSALESWLVQLEQMIGFLDTGLQPLLRDLPAGDLTLVPVGLLSMLPLSAALLGTPPAGGVSTVPTLRRRVETQAVAAQHNLVVADPSLAWAGWEAAAVTALLAPAATPAADAAPQDVLASLPAHGVVHFACHGSVDPGSPLASRLDLPGGRLTVGDVLHGDLPPLALVVLSACETGLTDPHQFDEGIAFPAAFIAATGADVLSTLWKVDDLSTSLLVLRFYWELRHDVAPGPLALARAQSWQRSTSVEHRCVFLAEAEAAGVLTTAAADAMAAALRKRCSTGSENPFAHPYHWAGFTYAN